MSLPIALIISVVSTCILTPLLGYWALIILVPLGILLGYLVMKPENEK